MKKSQESSQKKPISLKVPVDLFFRLKLMAEKEHRSLNQQIIFLLGGVNTPEVAKKK